MTERRALVVTTQAAASTASNGATLRASEVIQLLHRSGYAVDRVPAGQHLGSGRYDVGVAVSYACAAVVSDLKRSCDRVWLDAVDSWLLVNASGLRRAQPSYALRALRDAAGLARMPSPDLVTWISAADRTSDRGTIRGGLRLVLPASTRAPVVPGLREGPRRVVLAGDWDYGPNRDALRRFARSVLPALEERSPGDDWVVTVFGTGTGSGSGSGRRLARSARVHNLGYAEDPRDLYREGDVHAAPVRYGAGVKRKVLQPLLSGLPVVTTAAGAHGLRHHPLLDVHDDPHQQAAALARRLRSPTAPARVDASAVLDADHSAAVAEWLEA